MKDESVVEVLKKIYLHPKYSFTWLVLTVIFIFVMGIPTALIPNPLIGFVRMTSVNPIDYLLLFSTALLLAAYFTMHIYQRTSDPNPKRHFLAFGGGFLGFISFACPTCDTLLFALFGGTFLVNYFEPVRHWVGLLALLVISVTLFYKAKNLNKCKFCRPKGKTLNR